ncbi:guanine nucleotide binding protein alpha subunit [Gloeophyllum trabeum ATCC 11539]|uniref:Guanine nucleotide binding protein alpha subunit n=1 Tax=Gloeophyllum trabeum (strain ATCC 11539 / FP-39264 / Madison 617) TaxID=670483 RepID=S7Q2T6_GLOTA|nr:guanine nucleotide binding protein alpha subunit [Gloeophyllum trabeum ATCC 11539]EPQ53862.1 guanine nucleotide binding protein alpha subunit [Gloeophyllum trabeum ATCC 11539]
MGRLSIEHDPLACMTAPPANETWEQKLARERREAEAKRISDEIDQKLKSERAALKRNKKPVKVLLLGQAESGKSTTLKNFQLAYAREAWQQERTSWRAVIQLNLIRSIRTILDAVVQEMAGNPPSYDSDDENPVSPTSRPPLQFSEKHRLLKFRLLPLRRVEADLKRRLGAASEEISASVSVHGSSTPEPGVDVPPDFAVRSWKDAFQKPSMSPKPSSVGHGQVDSDDATDVIAECREDIKALWEDPVVRQVLKRRNVSIEESSGFFLNDIDRIAVHSYMPTDGDVMRARLRTVGVQEHRITFEEGPDIGHEWVIYDVGGCRTSRAAWVPYFEDVNAIIFLAPVSGFDERLAEDPSVNRLEDTFLLWKSIASSPLLAGTAIILFMNKCDILEQKVKRGVVVRKYMPSYGDRENSTTHVLKYLRGKFKEMLKQYSPRPRPFYAYATSVVDTKATAVTLTSVRDAILRDHLKQADFVF